MEIEEEEVRLNLIEKLKEYKDYKNITRQLKFLEEKRLSIYTKEPSYLVGCKTEPVNESIDGV